MTKTGSVPSIFSTIAMGIACLVLVIIGWSVFQANQQPDVGALWTQTGTVYYAHKSSLLLRHDRILSIDEVSLPESSFPYYL